MAVGLAVRQRGAAGQQAQPWAGLRTVWVRVGMRMWGRPAAPVQGAAERASDATTAWADTQPAMFWNPLHAAPEEV